MSDVIVYKNRTNVIQVDLGFDVSDDDLTSEIREGKTTLTTLIATWDIAFLTDGNDGKLVLTLDDSVCSTILQKSGYMDIKRVTAGEPVPVFAAPLKVQFKDVVTV